MSYSVSELLHLTLVQMQKNSCSVGAEYVHYMLNAKHGRQPTIFKSVCVNKTEVINPYLASYLS